MKLITLGDFIDVYSKIKQRGLSFILSKLTVNKNKRSISAFNKSNKETSNFWIIPYFNKRINTLVSGDSNVNFETFLVNKHLKDRVNLKLLSIGSGKCIHEIRLSKYHQFEKVVCLDINQENLDYAKRICKEENINNIEFICLDIKQFEFKENYFDIVLFSSSLHHFENVEELIKTKIKPTIKTKGLLVIYEFVGSKRLQFPKYQMKAINDALKLIPKLYRKRYKT
jgi:ubiquinone/menaquinone biosynthesis C-methylase UbiE